MVDETTANTEAPAANAELNINDLSAMKSIIDVASSRGAFKPNEMVPVGTVYAKLEAFLSAAQAQSQAAQQAAQAAQQADSDA